MQCILFKVHCTHAYIWYITMYVSCNASLCVSTFCCLRQHIQKLHFIRGTVNAQTIVRRMHCPSIIITRSLIVEAPMLSLERHRRSAIALEAHIYIHRLHTHKHTYIHIYIHTSFNLTLPSHTTPAVWEQLLLIHPEWRHQPSAVSLPVQSTSERMALPAPRPKKDPVVALTAPPSPSCLHTTLALFRSQPSSQTVLQDPA